MQQRFNLVLPEVKPVSTPNFNVLQDVMALHYAMYGAGADTKTICAITAGRSSQERAQIALMYYKLFGKEIQSDIRAEASIVFNLQTALCGLFEGRLKFIENMAFSSDEKCRIAAILLMTEQDKMYLKQRYLAKLTKEQQVVNERPPEHPLDFRGFDAVVTGCLPGGGAGQLMKAWLISDLRIEWPVEQAAEELHKAAKGAGTDEHIFVKYICSSTPECYQKICQVYEQKYKKTVEQTIVKEFNGENFFAYSIAHMLMINPNLAVPYAIHRCIKGAGTADMALIYITLAFSDYYKGSIVDMYKPFGDFVKDVKKDLNGKYQDLILMLWGAQ